MKYSKILKINLIISCIISLFMTIILANAGFFGVGLFDVITKGMLSGEAESIIFFLAITVLCFGALILMYLPIHIIKLLLFTKDTINKRYVDTKQSVYTRDLPKYNSSIAGELVDFKTTFEQEYVAGLIELISKGYVIEREDGFSVDTSKSIQGLLRNEKYILRTCMDINFNLRFINTYEFYKEIKEDMLELGLYKRETIFKKLRDEIRCYLEKNKNGTLSNLFYILFMMLPLIIFAIIRNIPLMIGLYLIIIILIRKNKLTLNGELEKENMSKLKLFLEKETDFKNKEEIEREVWGRYSAFAVAFGLNKEMKEEIERKLKKSNDKLYEKEK